MGYNSAYFFQAGKLVGQYNKKSDFEENLSEDPNMVHINDDNAPIIRIECSRGKSIYIGIEICLDHVCRVLKNYLETQCRYNDTLLDVTPDIHIVLSACVENIKLSISIIFFAKHNSRYVYR